MDRFIICRSQVSNVIALKMAATGLRLQLGQEVSLNVLENLVKEG